ncbi:hypothetical protein PsorP6_002939 [Peronosclerospora sorghi]|uniref:Uncharacterized protein n=1 Tax=Peronosclerospora sorghi TaxID=230839 RepID=A0ACC0VLL3_9STRA|nr:hypothetical protein PsorP6_002939 [Peronosclerospora sorghi]
MTASIYGGRYMLLIMGAFAIYAGVIYNDFFSRAPLNLFGSKCAYPDDCLDSHRRDVKCLAEYKIHDGHMTYVNATDVSNGDNVYAMGLDRIGNTSSNELVFLNSFKMKISVIFGIVQMTFGILLNAGIACISASCRPPSRVSTLINIALTPGNVVDPLYEGQLETQQLLFLLACLSVPAMLILKPLYLKSQHDRTASATNPHVADEAEGEHLVARPHGHSSGEKHEFELGGVVIHQGIETIKFVLGMVSKTASYLRLWALSLALSALATVFWEKTMLSSINSDSFLAIFIGFAVFALTTFGVILAMDVLECFSHALRRHWVEFQNKFYKADRWPQVLSSCLQTHDSSGATGLEEVVPKYPHQENEKKCFFS